MDWSSTYIYPKCKGISCYLFCYNGEWVLDCKFPERFWKIYNSKFDVKEEDLTYKFILTGDDQLFLLSAHSRDSLKEVKVENFEYLKPIAKVSSLEESKTFWRDYNEYIKGYVIMDKHFHRWSLEFPIFQQFENLELERPDTKFTNDYTKCLIEIIRIHSHYKHDIEIHLKDTPLYQEYLLYNSDYLELCKSLDEEFEKLKNIKSKKDYCLAVKNMKNSSFLISMFMNEDHRASYLFLTREFKTSLKSFKPKSKK